MGIDVEEKKFAGPLYIPIGIDYIGSPFTGFLGKSPCPRNVIFEATADIISRCRGVEYFPSHPYGLQLVWNTDDVPFLKNDVIFGSWIGQNLFQLYPYIFRLPEIKLDRSSVHSLQ